MANTKAPTEEEEEIHYVRTASKGLGGVVCHAAWASLTMANPRAQTDFCSVCGIMRALENLCMPLPKALKMRPSKTQWCSSPNRLLVAVPDENPHGTMRILEKLCMRLQKVSEKRAVEVGKGN